MAVIIGGYPFYGVNIPIFNPYGNMAYSIKGAPIPYGPGNFSVILLGVPYSDEFIDSVTVTDGNAVFTSGMGTYQSLLTLWRYCLTPAANHFTNVQMYDPRIGGDSTISGKLKFPQLLGSYSGAALVNVRLDFETAFLTESQGASYIGGYVSPGDETPLPPPTHIPGDLPPPPDPDLDYFWGNGHWGSGYWGRGEGV